mmetsp:Transcript_18004/g.49387  ORF Transcript_18004/g.49387 Transcript_18004/m.49387 type:complete len:206 (+) Transcript_18004:918-1535(+)
MKRLGIRRRRRKQRHRRKMFQNTTRKRSIKRSVRMLRKSGWRSGTPTATGRMFPRRQRKKRRRRSDGRRLQRPLKFQRRLLKRRRRFSIHHRDSTTSLSFTRPSPTSRESSRRELPTRRNLPSPPMTQRHLKAGQRRRRTKQSRCRALSTPRCSAIRTSGTRPTCTDLRAKIRCKKKPRFRSASSPFWKSSSNSRGERSWSRNRS